MTIRSRKFSKQTNRVTLDQRIDQAIIWITVLALVALPLFFSFFHFVSVFNEPKVVMLHLTAGLIAILWLWQIVLNRINDRSANDDGLNWDLLEWTGRNPARWALVGIAVWVFAQLASTILSPLPIISFFGGDEARSGYNLYDNLSLIVILLSVAVRFRTFKTLQILAYTLVITGTIAAAYGIAQHFGWDPIGNNGGRTRVIASFGNTLNFGGYMVMSIPATLAFTYKKFDRNRTALVIFTLALALQVSGIWFTGSRGPWVGCTASIISFFAITAVLGNKKESLKGLGILAAASVIAAIVAVIPTEQDDIGLSRVISIGNQFSSETSSTDIGGGLSGRFNIWESTLKMATQWELPVEEPTANKLLRPLFGVGQDIYVYAFPLVGKPQTNLSLVDHAHNYELQILAEQGFVGFLAFVSSAILLCLAVLVMVRRMRRSGNGIDTAGFLVLALSPAMIGKLVEMQSGVARISDLAMNMALLGSGIAIYEVVNRHLSSAQIDHHKTAARKPSSVNFSASNQMVITSTIVAAVLVTVVFISIFVSWDLRRLSASRTLATGYDAQTVEERARIWDKVQAKAPERESFTFTLFEKYWIAAKQQHELGNKEEALRLLNIGRDMLLAYEEHDPLELDTQTGLMKAATTMAVWGYSEFQQELANRAIKLAEANPAYPTIIGTSATALTSVGLHKLAIEYADQAIATEATTRPWSKAWYAKGRALYELGREDEAIEVLITATEKEPGAEGAILSHQILSQIYKAQGDDDRYNLHAELGQVDITVQE
jgi:O-antigen ligase/tetratricopeptide (TPR) repeat protein